MPRPSSRRASTFGSTSPADGYAQLIRLPQYRLANVTGDPDHGFARPRFAVGGAAVDDVIDRFRAGEPVTVVA